MKLRCIKELQTKKITFRVGEIYRGTSVNDTWYLVESVGINAKNVKEYFDEVD